MRNIVQYVLFIGTLGFVIFWMAFRPIPLSGIFTGDFIEYWSAFRLFFQGQNPYDPIAMGEIQRAFGRGNPPLMMWNPPWTLFLLAPILLFPLPWAAWIWMVLNGMILWVTWKLLIRMNQNPEEERNGNFIPYVLFPPFLSSLFVGQLGILLFFFVVLLHSTLRTKGGFLTGIVAALLTLKPHLFLLVFWYLFLCALRDRSWKMVGGGIGMLTFMGMCATAVSPKILPLWWSTLLTDHLVGGIEVGAWRGSTLIGILQGIPALSPSLETLRVGLLLIGLILTALIFLRSRNPYEDFPSVIALSVLFAPLGWFFDYSILGILLPIFLMNRCVSRGWMLLGMEVITLVLMNTLITEHHQLILFPILLILIHWQKVGRFLLTLKNLSSFKSLSC